MSKKKKDEVIEVNPAEAQGAVVEQPQDGTQEQNHDENPVEEAEQREEQPAAPANPAPAQKAAPANKGNLTGARLVRVHAVEEFDCYVCGQHYVGHEGKEYQFPTDVAAILGNARKVYRV